MPETPTDLLQPRIVTAATVILDGVDLGLCNIRFGLDGSVGELWQPRSDGTYRYWHFGAPTTFTGMDSTDE